MKQPLYQQIIDYLQNEIDSGRLPVGAQVPTEKELSAQFNVSRITSKRALTELETQGVIQRHQGKGSFVAGGNLELLREERLRHVEALLQEALDSAETAGISLPELHDMLDTLAES